MQSHGGPHILVITLIGYERVFISSFEPGHMCGHVDTNGLCMLGSWYTHWVAKVFMYVYIGHHGQVLFPSDSSINNVAENYHNYECINL